MEEFDLSCRVDLHPYLVNRGGFFKNFENTFFFVFIGAPWVKFAAKSESNVDFEIQPLWIFKNRGGMGKMDRKFKNSIFCCSKVFKWKLVPKK